MNIPIHKMILIPLVLLAAGCSVVFTGSITGELHDQAEYQADEAGSGIADASVYLYTEEEPWSEDLAAWAGGAGPLPDFPTDTDGTPLEPRYFLKTVSGEDGAFTFNGFIWEDLFPKYGKSGDRKEIFLLYYQEDYGLTGNTTPVYIVSDVTNRLPPTLLDRIYNKATIQGNITDADNGEPLGNVNIRVYVPADWSYDTAGAITDVTWNEEPSYIIATNETGRYEREISFPMKPDTETNEGTCFIRLTFSRNGYIAEHAADSDITDGGWDRDGDGTIEEGEDDAYYQSPVINADTTAEMAEITLTGEYNTATITGTVEDVADGEGVANVNVDVYVPDSWGYDGGGAMTDIVWPEEPSYSLVTGPTGDYTTEIEFAREPELTDNEGTTKVRIVFDRNGYETSDTIDSDITYNMAWDIDDNGTIEQDEAAYYESDWITDGRSETMATIDMRLTEYSTTVDGRIAEDLATIPVWENGVEVRLYIDRSAEPAPDNWDDRDYTETIVLTEGELQDGNYTFTGVEWDKNASTLGTSGNQTYITCYIGVDNGSGTFNLYAETIYSDSDNYFEYDPTP